MNQETTFIVPEGYELKQTGENQYSVVKKEKKNGFFTMETLEDESIPVPEQQEPAYNPSMDNIYLQQKIKAKEQSLYSDIVGAETFAYSDMDDRDRLFEERYGSDNAWLRERVKSGNLKLTKHEMELLRFCNSVNVKEFLREEFRRNPINIRGDEQGNIWVDKTPPSTDHI